MISAFEDKSGVLGVYKINCTISKTFTFLQLKEKIKKDLKLSYLPSLADTSTHPSFPKFFKDGMCLQDDVFVGDWVPNGTELEVWENHE